ncbi:latrophilin-like protein LAT-2 [Dysidea avara]|uniref:latrophilin-like protein LAT-2 n=1 Tax=Dysidea avara TaxID=196820 RepID=UPI0033263DA0
MNTYLIFTIVLTRGLTISTTTDILRCVKNTDTFGVTWPDAAADTNVTIPCPAGTGNSSRICNSTGNWQPSVITECRSYVIPSQVYNLNSTSQQEIVIDISKQLVIVTEPSSNTSAFPSDLSAIVTALNILISIGSTNDAIMQEDFVENIFEIHENILTGYNIPGWLQLQEIDRGLCEVFLLNVEKFSIQWAGTLNVSQSKAMIGHNIVISVEMRKVNSDEETPNVIWPQQHILDSAGLFNTTGSSASVRIPSSFMRKAGMASETGETLVVHVAYQNFLLTSTNTNDDDRSTAHPVSLILSSTVIAAESASVTMTPTMDNDPVILTFDFSLVNNVEGFRNLRCGFWDAELDQGSEVEPGGWSNGGVSIDSVENTTITCTSTHLTNFAALVGVSGATQDMSKPTRKALSVVSYIGCGISMVCLIASIILLIIFRKTFNSTVHNFTHLNLTIALLLALTVFVSGVETATKHRAACTVVAALLHYFFTAVFTWMLCEGIILYILLVKVFNTGVGQRKLFFFTLGWGLPIPIVAIPVGIAHDQYGTDDYCWISTEEGVIWAFTAPMLIIIMLIIIMVIVLDYLVRIANLQSSQF